MVVLTAWRLWYRASDTSTCFFRISLLCGCATLTCCCQLDSAGNLSRSNEASNEAWPVPGLCLHLKRATIVLIKNTFWGGQTQTWLAWPFFFYCTKWLCLGWSGHIPFYTFTSFFKPHSIPGSRTKPLHAYRYDRYCILCKYKIMRLGQIWRASNFVWFFIMQSYCLKETPLLYSFPNPLSKSPLVFCDILANGTGSLIVATTE